MPSFLDTYLSYTENNECPRSYHVFSGLTVLAGLTGGKVWVDQGYWRYNGDLYTVLVGIAGTGKSVAADIAIDLLQDIGNVAFSSDCPSPRKLLEEIAANHSVLEVGGERVDYSPLFAKPNELSNFISQCPGMLDTLTTIWGKKRHTYGTTSRGGFEIYGPSLTLLSCTTPEWIESNLRSDAISGGLSRRTLWILELCRDKVIPPSQIKVTEAMRKQWSELVNMGRVIQQVKGAFSFADGAQEYFDEWYVAEKTRKVEFVGGYAESKPGFVMKLAMLLALSDGKYERVIERGHIDRALETLAVMERNLARVFQGLGKNALLASTNKLIDTLKAKGGMARDSYLRSNLISHLCTKDYEAVLETLVKAERVKVGVVDKQKVIHLLDVPEEQPMEPYVNGVNKPADDVLQSLAVRAKQAHSSPQAKLLHPTEREIPVPPAYNDNSGL